jgi:hypothetical protein
MVVGVGIGLVSGSDGDSGDRSCEPGYSRCLDPNASDYDCSGGSGNGPRYVGWAIGVIGDDRFGLDRDGNGVACE